MAYRVEATVKMACDNCTNWANYAVGLGEDEGFAVVEEHLLAKAFEQGWDLEDDKVLCRDCSSQARIKHDLTGKTIQSVVFAGFMKEEHNWVSTRVDLFMEDGMCLSLWTNEEDPAVIFSVTT